MNKSSKVLLNKARIAGLIMLVVSTVTVSFSVAADSVADRFNELRGANETVSADAVSHSGLKDDLFNDEALDAATKWTETYDDSAIKDQLALLSEGVNQLGQYVDARDLRLKGIINSEVMLLQQYIATEGRNVKAQAVGGAAELDEALRVDIQLQVIRELDSLKSEMKTLIDLRMDQLDNKIANIDNFYRAEIARIEDLIGDRSQAASGEWVTLYRGTGTDQVEIPSVPFSKFRIAGTYRVGISHEGAFDAPITFYSREGDASSKDDVKRNAWCLPTDNEGYTVEWIVPMPKAGTVLMAPRDAQGALSGSCSDEQFTDSQSIFEDFKFTKVEIFTKN
ncbi:hypothetical protein [Vibrio owensii]|uniref:hypothetical protein n=1 Tax=Vibrio owensii TaxID=696485 RepID=UPI0018F25EE2|nr:hypothetical protein [Vibrio owensii]